MPKSRSLAVYLKYAATLLLLLTFHACDCSDGTDPFAGAPPGVGLYVDPVFDFIGQGQERAFTLTIDREGTFDGPVTLHTLGAMPAGVTVEFSPSVIAVGRTTTLATVRVAQNVPPQNESSHVLQIEARGDGVSDQAEIRFSVIPADAPALTLQIVPEQLELAPGATGDFLIKATRLGGYSGAVSFQLRYVDEQLSVAILPSGRTDEWILRVGIPANTTRSSYQFAVFPTAPGIETFEDLVHVRVLLPPRIELSVSRPVLRSTQSGSDTSTLFIGRFGNYNGPVALSIEGMPPGMTATLDPNPANGTASRLTVSVGSGATVNPNNYPLTIRGRGTGAQQVADATTTISYIVDRAQGGFTLSAANLSVVQGSTSTAPLTIGRSGEFNAPILISVARTAGGPALPPGMTISTPATVTSGNSLITVTTTAATPAGVYSFRVTGLAFQHADMTSDFTVTVTEAPRASRILITKIVNGAPQVTIGETLPVGSSVTLAAAVVDQNDQLMPNAPVTWSTTNTGTATVSATGMVTGVAPGQVSITARSTTDAAVAAAIPVTVMPTASSVARIEIEPKETEITAPATHQYRVLFYDAQGARTTAENGSTVEFSSSNTSVAAINGNGLATGKTGGFVTITARYLMTGQSVLQDATGLLVYNPTQGHYGSLTLVTDNNTRDIRRGGEVYAQLIVRDVNGVQLTSGISPAPELTASAGSNVQIVRDLSNTTGYFYFIRAAGTSPLGAFTIRYDVRGAGGQITMTVVP